MKISSLIAAVLFAGTAMTGVAYADDQAAAPKAAENHTEKAAVKPHSHVQEKTGMQQSMPDAKAEKTDLTKDKKRHLHTRDGK